jgi:hypothetical protein
MLKIKVAALAAVTTLAFATPSLAQNFQGFGASSEMIQRYESGQAQNKPVALKAHKRVTHVKAAH